MTDRKLATRHWCIHQGNEAAGLLHSEGTGKGPASGKCRYCKGKIVTERGLWGVFAWTGTGRYPAEAAERTSTIKGAAQRRADTLNESPAEVRDLGGWVVRWIPEGSL